MPFGTLVLPALYKDVKSIYIFPRLLLAKLQKPDVRKDSLLKAIDSAPFYQPIPTGLIPGDKGRTRYLEWRNKRVARGTESRNKLLDLQGKSVLDLGCNIGFLGWSNREIIGTYVGLDSDPQCIEAAHQIGKNLGYGNIRFVLTDIVDYIENTKEHYDCCLFFSIYHHLLYQLGIQQARRVLNKLSELCDELYFDMGQKNEPSNSSRQRWHDLLPDEAPELYIQQEVLPNTRFNKMEILGETEVGHFSRLLFKFTK